MSFINVISQNGKKYKINLNREIARGGEGVIYELDTATVAKVYHDGIVPINQKKFDFIKKLDKKYFIAPEELLFDAKSKVVGFTMSYLGSEFFPLSNIFTKSFCTAHNIDKKVKLKIIESLIKALEYAHSLKIVIGDLNCFNIMINNQGDIKMIDTDSYEVPGIVHSGRLLDDIRDYLYQGRIDEKSDCFALSILAFNMLAFTHPFKGIHKQYLKLADRMIHKAPIFVNDPDLKVPKCYEPIQDKNFMSQFERFYLKGERFLLSLSDVNPHLVVLTVNNPSAVKTYDQGDLLITNIASNCGIKQIMATNTLLVIETDTDFKVYDSRNKGYVTLSDNISKTDYDKIFVGKKNILLKKDKNLFVYHGKGKVTKITSFEFPDTYILKQYEDMIVVIDYDNMYKIFIDEVMGSIIKISQMSVYGKGFQSYNSLVYNSGGKQNIFYNESGKEMSIVNLPIRIRDLKQQDTVGVLEFDEKQATKYKLFKIKDSKIHISSSELPGWTNFCYRKTEGAEGFVFVPVDDAIKIYRTQDFAEISEMKCDLVTSESTLKNTNAGIVLLEDDKVWLLNKK
jgi:serine/threonine protein kinase